MERITNYKLVSWFSRSPTSPLIPRCHSDAFPGGPREGRRVHHEEDSGGKVPGRPFTIALRKWKGSERTANVSTFLGIVNHLVSALELEIFAPAMSWSEPLQYQNQYRGVHVCSIV